MTGADWLMDGALALALPFLAWRAVSSDHLPKAVVLFIALGLLSSLAWARLAAPDVALVEAAVGAGLTGSLLMSALGWVAPQPSPQLSRWYRLPLLMLLGAMAMGVVFILFQLDASASGLRDAVLDRLGDSGVSHPVTAVLLNFRAYDTLLEVAVLWAAVLASSSPAPRGLPRGETEATHPLLPVLARLLTPGSLLLAGYLLYRGSHAPGGAFQAGATLGGIGVLLILVKRVGPPDPASARVRGGLFLGPAVFLAVAVAALWGGRQLLEYPPKWAGGLILAIEASLTVSIALVLSSFFASVARLDEEGA